MLALALDLVLACCLPAAFLFAYVHYFFAPTHAVPAHLRLLVLPFVAFALLRLVVARTAPPALARSLAALAGSALAAGVALYYAVVLTGLQYWGRVVSWDLIRAYADQVPNLADALGISFPAALAAGALAYLALFGLAWLYLGRFDWVRALEQRLSGPTWLAFLAAGTAICAFQVHAFVAAPAVAQAEPISLTFYPVEADLEGHGVDRRHAAALDALEDQARAAYRPAARTRHSNLVLIIVDALRPDHMGVFGYRRDTTPNLARLEKEKRLRKVSSVRASCTASACGIFSLSSSKFVHQYSSRPITLQETLRRNGYRVHMILSGDHTRFYGLKKLYGDVDSYYDGADAHRKDHGRYINDDRLVLDRLAAFPAWDGTPTMLHIHLLSAHILGVRDPKFGRWTPALNYAVFNRSPKGPAETGINYYDNAVLQADATIGRLLDLLEGKHYLRNALVAITADHGEGLGEHLRVQHGNSVHEELLRVPLVLVSFGAPGGPAIDDRRLASHVDIAPTLLEGLGIPTPATWQGVPLEKHAARRFAYFRQGWESGLYDLGEPGALWKYWLNAQTGKEFAFDLTRDPHEDRNVLDGVAPELLRRWRLEVLSTASVGALPLPQPRPSPPRPSPPPP